MLEMYRLILDSSKNPLRVLPPPQQFQVMTYLGLMWTVIFCAAFGTWYWLGGLVLSHVLLALGFAITGWTFRSAQKMIGHRDYPREDGTARYDDLWGA